MRTFRVYHHPSSGYDPVKVGFSWPAFFFGFIWMLIKKLWGFAVLWFLLYVVLNVIETVTDQANSESGLQAIVYFSLSGAYLALLLVPGLKGNGWKIRYLEKRGFEFMQEVEAETPDSAKAIVAKSSGGHRIINPAGN